MRVNQCPNGKVPVMTRCCHGKTGRATVEPGYIEVTGNNAPVGADNVPDIADKYGYTQRGPTHLGVFIYSVIKLHKQFDKKYMDKYFI